MDCFVAPRLAMTSEHHVIASHLRNEMAVSIALYDVFVSLLHAILIG